MEAEKHAIGTLFFQNRHQKFLHRVYVRYASTVHSAKKKCPNTFCVNKTRSTPNRLSHVQLLHVDCCCLTFSGYFD
jgi:hypothetical protein